MCYYCNNRINENWNGGEKEWTEEEKKRQSRGQAHVSNWDKLNVRTTVEIVIGAGNQAKYHNMDYDRLTENRSTLMHTRWSSIARMTMPWFTRLTLPSSGRQADMQFTIKRRNDYIVDYDSDYIIVIITIIVYIPRCVCLSFTLPLPFPLMNWLLKCVTKCCNHLRKEKWNVMRHACA